MPVDPPGNTPAPRADGYGSILTIMRELLLDDLDARIRWIEFPGREPARVFIHGLGCTGASDFADIAAHPRLTGRRSILIDLLGFGFSDRPAEFCYSVEDHARVVATVLDHLGLAGVQLIGHSMGGTIAILLAHRRPDLVSRLVTCEPNLVPGGGQTSRVIAAHPEPEFIRSGYAKMLRATHMWTPSYAARLRLADPVALHRSAVSLVQLGQPTPAEILAGLGIPRTYLVGSRNLDDPDTRIVANLGIEIREIPEAGHDMALDNPDAFATALAAVLAPRP